MKTPYSFVTLHYVHDVVTGEFANVGVVLYAPEQRLLLAVECQEVVHGEVEFRDGGFKLEGGVRSMPVVVVEEGGQMGGAQGGVLVSARVGPFA